MRNKNPFAVRTAVFWLIFALLFALMARFYSDFPDYRSYQAIAGFYEEEAGGLDAVYLGSSNCYAFWNAPVAWHDYGLTVYPYTSPSQPFYAVEYLIRETRKTQPNAMYIVNVNAVEADDLDATSIHYLINYMPESEIREALMNHLADLLGYSAVDRLEFRFPWMRIRELWLDRLELGPVPGLDGLKGASTYENYLSGIEDISGIYRVNDRRAEIPEVLAESVRRLLDYCDREGIRVLFVVVPRAETSDEAVGRINAVCDMIRDMGGDVLDMSGLVDEIGIDLTQDFYNAKHSNVHGSVKFTNYLSEYLMEHYGLKDRQINAVHTSWDEAWLRWSEKAGAWLLDFELDASHRDYALAAPLNLTLKKGEGRTALRWSSVAGADGYAVYRKSGRAESWTKLGDAQRPAFEDAGIPQEGTCVYTVVPWRNMDGEVYYGNFNYSGVEAQ